MGRPLRLFEPDGIYFITGRCLQARLLMRPDKTINNIIGGVLAKALSQFINVECFAFVFTSNHFHMLLRSKDCQIPAFMQYLRSNLAKKLGAHVDWSGKFWDRRYDAEPVLDDTALIGRLRYILAHGVKEGLVVRCQDWPGLSSIPELTYQPVRLFSWPGQKDKKRLFALKISRLPCFEDFSEAFHQQEILEMCVEIEAEYAMERGSKPVLGVEALMRQSPHDKPKSIKRGRRPLCHSSTRSGYIEYKTKYRLFAEAYQLASWRYRNGDWSVEFPLYSYRPPWAKAEMKEAA